MNLTTLLNTPKEIDNLESFEQDRTALESFMENYENYVAQLLSIKTRAQAQDFSDAIAPLSYISNKWKNDFPRYRLIRDNLEFVRKIQDGLDEKVKQLRLGEKRTIPESPSLSVFSREHNLVKSGDEHLPEPQVKENLEMPNLEAITSAISLKDLDEFYETQGLVGEKSTRILQTLGAINLLSFGIESLSGSGKSYTIDFLMKLLPEDYVYKMELSSRTAESYETEEINKKKIIYIPELQKAMNSGNVIITEILKNITEGKDASRKVRDQANGVNRKYVITGDKGVIFTLATENTFKYDAEFSRRVFLLHTDISAAQTARILEHIGSQEHSLEQNHPDSLLLKDHIKACMDMDQINYFNPFASYLATLIPKNIRSRSYAKYLFDLINACAKFNHKERTLHKNTLLINLEDVYNIGSLYGSQFIKSLLKVPLIGEETLGILKENTQYSAQEVYLSLKKINPDLTFKLTTTTLDRLVDAGFLEKQDHRSRDPMYYRTGDMPNFDLRIDYNECWEIGKECMESQNPKIYEEWLSQLKDGKIETYDIQKERQVAIIGN